MSPFRQYHPLAPGRLAILLTLGPLAGCAGTPMNLDVSPTPGATGRATIGRLTVARFGVSVRPRPVVSGSAAQVLATADRYVGTRYRYGGESPAEGFDCSGFVQFVYSRHGVELPRTSRQQVSAGRATPRAITALQPAT